MFSHGVLVFLQCAFARQTKETKEIYILNVPFAAAVVVVVIYLSSFVIVRRAHLKTEQNH